MDGLAKEQETAIRKILRELEKVKGNKKYIVDTRNKAHELQLANWILSWTTMPIQNTQCQTNQFTVQYCVTSDFTSTIATYNGRAAELFQLGQQALNALKKKKGKKFTKADAKLINKVNSTYKEALKASDMAPKNHATCS